MPPPQRASGDSFTLRAKPCPDERGSFRTVLCFSVSLLPNSSAGGRTLTQKLLSLARRLPALLRSNVLRLSENLETIGVHQGSMHAALNREFDSADLQDYEFKVFSQWGDDGIIQRLIDVVEIENTTFIEFGVEDFSESNCRFLMMKDNWSGFVIDGSPKSIARLKSSYFYWQYDLRALCSFITRENINQLLAQSDFADDLGILSIDLDGNDYHVLESISSFSPRILICEYNAVFGSERKVTVPYRPDFHRTEAHHSNLYWGASLSALNELAHEKGYSLVGTNLAGNNAFFVRDDLMDDRIRALSVEDAFTDSKFRESRNPNGTFSHLHGEDRARAIKGLQVLNTEKGQLEAL